MADKPAEMYRNGRHKVDVRSDEPVYRRVSPEDWGEPHPEVDALDLPNMSVNRGSPIGESLWVLLESDEHAVWGIVYFLCRDVPDQMRHTDGTQFTFGVEHVPQDDNYPHSEVRAYLSGTIAQARRLFDPDLSLRWRNKLLQRTRVYRRPGEDNA